MSQRLEERLNRAQDILKRIGRARDRKTDVSVGCLYINLNSFFKVLEATDCGLAEGQSRALGRWLYLMRYYPENWVSTIL